MSAAALAAACREGLADHQAGLEGRGSYSRDLAHWAGKPDQVGTTPEVGNPCHIHRAQEDQAQVVPSLVEVGREGTCLGSGILVRQAGREDRLGQEAG